MEGGRSNDSKWARWLISAYLSTLTSIIFSYRDLQMAMTRISEISVDITGKRFRDIYGGPIPEG